jgi:type IV pilus assembly protein PilM
MKSRSRLLSRERNCMIYFYNNMSFLSNIFKPEDESVVGVDIGSSAIKLIQIKKKNSQAVLETYGELALGPYGGGAIGQAVVLPPEKIAQALMDLMKEKEVNVTTKRCGVSIPFASSLMTVVEMPHVSAKQLEVMVPLEARKYIPVPISEVMLDWSIIPKNEVNQETDNKLPTTDDKIPETGNIPKVDVLVVAIHKDTIAKYETIVRQAGLEASFFEIEIFSTMRSVLDQALTPVMIMDIGAASTKLYIVERGVIKSSHTINRGSQDITLTISKSMSVSVEQAEVMKRQAGASGEDKQLRDIIALTLDYIFEEANRTLLSFEKKYNKTVSRVILVGGGSALKGRGELAKNNFKTEAVAGDPFSKVAAPAFLEKVLKETGPEFAVAIGVALRKLAEEE